MPDGAEPVILMGGVAYGFDDEVVALTHDDDGLANLISIQIEGKGAEVCKSHTLSVS